MHLRETYKALLTIPQGHRALLICSNFGSGNVHAQSWTWNPTDTTAAPTAVLYAWPQIPASQTTNCSEMRGSKSTLRVLNNTPQMMRSHHGNVLITSQRPQVTTWPFEAGTANQVNALNAIYTQVWGRNETKPYVWSDPREICNVIADPVDYYTYRAPASETAATFEGKTLHKDGAVSNVVVPMTITYFIADAPGSTSAQTLEIHMFTSFRCRYDMVDPMSKQAQPIPYPTPREERLMDVISQATVAGHQPGTHT